MQLKISRKQINKPPDQSVDVYELSIKATGTEKEIDKFNKYLASLLDFIKNQLK